MKKQTVEKIRAFNRFYMPALDLLGNHYLGSEYSAAEARVLFEIYGQDGCNAAHIARVMHLDKSYLSRIIKGYEKEGYLIRIPSETDGRAFSLHLTEKGKARTEDFIEKSNRQIGEIISPLSDRECEDLAAALDTVTEILNRCRPAAGKEV